MALSISSPRKMASDVDMQIDCEIAIDMATRDLVDAVIQAGWPPKIAYSALKNVARNQALAYQDDPDPADDPEPEQITVGSILPSL